MKEEIIYIVTKESDDGTFRVGDHIKLCDNGDIICFEARGWITAEEVDSAIKGMEYKIDEEYIEEKVKRLQKLINKLVDTK